MRLFQLKKKFLSIDQFFVSLPNMLFLTIPVLFADRFECFHVLMDAY